MKYDLNKKQTKFAVRVLSDLSTELIRTLTKKPFEHITVNEICEATSYPRATFYNYFSDLDDLLEYCFSIMIKNMDLGETEALIGKERNKLFFNRVYDYLNEHRENTMKMLEHNSLNGEFIGKLYIFAKKHIYKFFFEGRNLYNSQIQSDIIAEHFTNTYQLIIKRCFYGDDILSKEQAIQALDYLLGNLG